MASLPELRFDGKPPLSADAFLDRCRGVVSEPAMRVLAGVRLLQDESVAPVEVLERWRAREFSLRNALAGLRAHRLGIDPARHVRGAIADMEAAQAARRVFEAVSPRAAGDELDRMRWAWLEELESGHYFDLDRLVIYLLKLLLLERRAVFSKEAGRAVIARFQNKAEELSRQACEETEASS